MEVKDKPNDPGAGLFLVAAYMRWTLGAPACTWEVSKIPKE